MNITSAQYDTGPIGTNNMFVNIIIDGKAMAVPMQVGNRHYDEILRQVAAGTLTIEDAD